MNDIGKIFGAAGTVGSAAGAIMGNPVVSTVGGALSSLGSIFGGGDDIKKQYTYWKYAYERQRKGNMEDWLTQTDYVNEYNSPEKTMQRLLKAGMNPNLAYQNAQGWHSAQSAVSAGSPSFHLQDFSAGRAQIAQLISQLHETQSRIELNQAEKKKIETDTKDKQNEMDVKDYVSIWQNLPRAQVKRELSLSSMYDENTLASQVARQLNAEIWEQTVDWNNRDYQFLVEKTQAELGLQKRQLDIADWLNNKNVQLASARLALDKQVAQSTIAQNIASAGMLYQLGVLHSVNAEGVKINNKVAAKMLGRVPEAVLNQFGLNQKGLWNNDQTFISWADLTQRLEFAQKYLNNVNLGLSNDMNDFLLGLQKYRYGENSEWSNSDFGQALSRVLFSLGINGNTLLSVGSKALK